MKMERVTGVRTSAGAGSAVIPAPSANQEVQIYFSQIQAESETPVTVLLKGGSATVDRVRCARDGGGKMREYTDRDSISCGAGNAVFVDLSADAQIGYVIEYRVIGVG